MAQLTQSYLEGLGFQLSWSRDHGYRAQYTKYDEDVTRAIILISQTDSISALSGQPDELFDVWFYGQSTQGQYSEIDSYMTISSQEELESLLSLFRK